MISKIQLSLMSIGYLLTFFYVGLTYSSIRQSAFYPYISAIFALLLGLSWGFIAKLSNTGENIYFINALWDVGVSLIWILMPIILCGVSLTLKQLIGVFLLVLGCFLIK